MYKVHGILIFIVLACNVIIQLNPIFAPSHPEFAKNTLVFYGKGQVEQGHAPGQIVRILINGDKATVVHPGINGIEIVRLRIQPSDVCIQTEATICFDGIVSETKNVQAHKKGDKIGITLDLKNKKSMLSFTSGIVSEDSATINLSKSIIHLNAPNSVTLMQEGGFAGIQKEFILDAQMWELAEDSTITKLDPDSIHEITKHIKKLKFSDVDDLSYPPIPGSADYFVYSLIISQSVVQKTITWTDTSENVPNELVTLKDAITGASESSGPADTIQVKIAKDFVMSSPTFLFDGMPETLEVRDAVVLESFPEQYVITIEFTSRHGGYGERTDQIVTEALTPHKIVVTVVENEVVSAIIDDKWDELNQEMMES